MDVYDLYCFTNKKNNSYTYFIINRFFAFLFVFLCGFSLNAETITKDFSTEFNYLNNGMPSAFEIGQKVDISLGIEDTYEGANIPVSAFNLTVEFRGLTFYPRNQQP